MKSLLELHADGYFIKESPELGFTNDFSRENVDNFISTAKNCLEKGYLQDHFTQKQRIEGLLQVKSNNSTNIQDYNDFLNELITQIDISYNLLYPANSVSEFAYAFFSLYKVLEGIGKKKTPNNIPPSRNHRWNEVNKSLEPNVGPNNNSLTPGVFQRITDIHKVQQNLNDNTFFEKLYWVKEWRNDVGHALTNTTPAEIAKFKRGYLDLLEIIESIMPVL